MLWYKAWRESRMRFILSMVALAAVCLLIVTFQHENRGGDSYAKYIWVFTYDVYASNLFLVSVLLLGLGGLLREQTNGTAGFTLALPVSRWRLIGVRAALGLLQMTALAMLPSLLLPTLSPLVHETYPLSQALQFSVLWVGCGASWFATGFFLSTILSGEYTMPAACVIALVAYLRIVNLFGAKVFPFLNLNNVMSGDDMPYFRESTNQLIGPFPWTQLAVITLIALGVLAATAYVTQQQDF
jgi:ABC-2 type transport system permease protein